MRARLAVRDERWPLAQAFRIARGSRTQAHVVVAEITRGTATGRGECVPYSRYGETVAGVMAAIAAQDDAVAGGLTREDLLARMPAGAARNALDCALWDLEARETGQPVWRRAGLPAPSPCMTAYTISLGPPAEMAEAAAACGRPLLKLKLGEAETDLARVAAVAAAAPAATLIADANEGWTLADLARLAPPLAELGLTLIEQPLPAGADAALAGFASPVPLCADESIHGPETLEAVAGRYQMINLKLDKTGGLTAALALAEQARAQGLDLMVGCMVATSLAMAPAALLAPLARIVDLDGPLLLARDRPGGLRYDGATLHPPGADLWGLGT